MLKNIACDPITDQEMAFVHLILSGTMNDRRSLTRNQPATPPDTAEIDTSECRRPQRHQDEGTGPCKVVAAAEGAPEQKRPPQPAPNPANNTPYSHLDRNHSNLINPFIHSPKPTWVSGDADSIFDAALQAINSVRLPFCPELGVASRLNTPKRPNFIEFYKSAGSIRRPWAFPRSLPR